MYVEGGCINSSPAGKRRIPIGAEQQQISPFGDENDFFTGGKSETTGVLSHVASPLTTITALAVAGCLLIITVFVVIFAVLQVRFQFNFDLNIW